VSIEQDFAMVREGLHSPMTYADDEEEQAALSRIEVENEWLKELFWEASNTRDDLVHEVEWLKAELRQCKVESLVL
jgi:hypothetical protein